jgi:hypothetical protein
VCVDINFAVRVVFERSEKVMYGLTKGGFRNGSGKESLFHDIMNEVTIIFLTAHQVSELVGR